MKEQDKDIQGIFIQCGASAAEYTTPKRKKITSSVEECFGVPLMTKITLTLDGPQNGYSQAFSFANTR